MKVLSERLRGRLQRPAARWSWLVSLAALAGLAGGLAAAGLEWGLHHGTELLVGRITHLGGDQTMQFHWAVLLLPAAGGLASGLIVLVLCRGSRMQGTDTLVRAFHHEQGDLPLRAPLVRATAAVGVLSTGGSAGPEGPIAALGAALGSTVGRLFRVTPRQRRALLIAGCAAGIGAIFRCPLGGALFAAAVLYREPEFEADGIVPGFIASVVGYTAFMSFWGFGEPLLPGAGRLVFTSAAELPPYQMRGVLCGLVSILMGASFRVVSDHLLPRSRLPYWLAPAVGGLATGALACLLPQVMDGRYAFVRNMLDGSMLATDGVVDWWWWARLLALVVVSKCVATALTVGSGASGGVLGPSVFIGGVTGALCGALLSAVAPEWCPEPLRRALIPVGMGGVLAAVMRTPLAAIVMATEMAGSYGLIVPSMLVCMVSYVIGRAWGLNREQVRSSAESPAHAADAVIHLLEGRRARDVTDAAWPLVAAPDTTLSDMVRRMEVGTRPVFAVLRDGALEGVVSVSDLRRAAAEPGLGEAIIAADIMTTNVASVGEDDDLHTVLHAFHGSSHDVLPVVARDGRRWLGMLTRTRLHDVVQEHVRGMSRAALAEHGALATIEGEGQLAHLLAGLSPVHRDAVHRMAVPVEVVGQSLRGAAFAQRFGVQVLAVEGVDGRTVTPPDVDRALSAGDVLVVLSPATASR